MKTRRTMASTAKKSAKIISAAGAAVFCMGIGYSDDAAAQAAMRDILNSEGEYLESPIVAYTWDPFRDGMIA